VTEIYIDGDACPVREEVYRVATRLGLGVFVVSNGSRPIRPPGLPNVRMILVGDASDAADDWIAERIGAADVCVTSDVPLASRCLAKGRARLARTGGSGQKRISAVRSPAASSPGICANWVCPRAARRR